MTYLLNLCRSDTIIFLSRNKDKTLQIVPHCGIIRGCTANIFLPGVCHSVGNIVYKQSQYKTAHLFYTQENLPIKLVTPCTKWLVYCLISGFMVSMHLSWWIFTSKSRWRGVLNSAKGMRAFIISLYKSVVRYYLRVQYKFFLEQG